MKNPDSKTDSNIDISSIPLLSFFTGAGFLDLGFHKAGFRNVIWRNEFNQNFARGFDYAMNSLVGKNPGIVNPKSIHYITSNEIINEAFGSAGKPEVFGVIGGSPCPDFSVGGKNRGENGQHGQLTQIYIDKIISLQPTFFLLENVAGLSRTGKHRSFLGKIITQLQEHFSISHRVLNALDFGAPQFRERVFLVGFNKNWIKKEFDTEIPDQNERWFPWGKEKYPNARNAYKWTVSTPFGDNPPKPIGIPDELMVGTHICKHQEDLSKIANGADAFNPKSDKFLKIEEGDSSRKSFKRLHRWRYSPAAAYGNNEVHLHPTEPRRLTVREVLRLQTVPDKYELPKDLSLSHKFKMIGNGVPVVLAEAVANSFVNVFRNGILKESQPYLKLTQ
jgi:DNA (cytosine-5)-methyltransferase 1